MAAIRANVTASIGVMSFPVDVQSGVKADDDGRAAGVIMTCDHSVDENGKEVRHDTSGVEQFYECKVCKRRGGRDAFGRSFSSADGFADINESDMDALKADESTTKAMSFVSHPVEDFESLTPAGKIYNLACKPGDKNYALAAEMLRQGGSRFALATVWAARSKNALYRLRERNGCLQIQQYAWPSDVNARPAAPELAEGHAAYVPTMLELMEATMTPLNADTYLNERREKLEALRSQALGDAAPVKKVEKSTVKASDSFAESLALALKEAKAAKPGIAETEGKKRAPRKATTKKAVASKG